MGAGYPPLTGTDPQAGMQCRGSMASGSGRRHERLAVTPSPRRHGRLWERRAKCPAVGKGRWSTDGAPPFGNRRWQDNGILSRNSPGAADGLSLARNGRRPDDGARPRRNGRRRTDGFPLAGNAARAVASLAIIWICGQVAIAKIPGRIRGVGPPVIPAIWIGIVVEPVVGIRVIGAIIIRIGAVIPGKFTPAAGQQQQQQRCRNERPPKGSSFFHLVSLPDDCRPDRDPALKSRSPSGSIQCMCKNNY